MSPSHKFTPMLIDFAALQSKQEAPPTESSETAPSKPTPAIKVTSPRYNEGVIYLTCAKGLFADMRPFFNFPT